MTRTKTAPDMRRTWLVQRLSKPFTGGIFGPDNPFSFGGGMRNGGLSDDAMGLIRGIFAFDYMGSAEFEFGAVPKALDGLAKSHKSLVADSMSIRLADVAAGWRTKDDAPPEGDATVYLLCRKGQRAEVEARVRAMAAKDYEFKEATRLPSTLRPEAEYDGETVGWLELDNGFMFFTDREMWEQTCALFGVKAAS